MGLNEKDSGDEPKKFGFMAAWLVGQWICHSRNVTKTDIFAAQAGGQSGKSTRGSIRFDSPRADRALGFDRDEPSLQSGGVFR